METSPTEFQKRTLWRAVTGIAIFVLGFLLVALIWLVSQLLGYLQPVLIPIAVSGVIAYLLDPFVSWFQKKGLNRLQSVITVFSSFILAIVMMGFLIVPPIVNQAKDLFTAQTESGENQLGQSITQTLSDLRETPWIKPAADWALAKHEDSTTDSKTEDANQHVQFSETNLAHEITARTEYITAYATKFLSQGTSTILASLGLIIGLAMVPIYLYYFLKESAAIKSHWHDYVPLKASQFKDEVVETLQEINGYLISFFRGQMLVAFIDGILVGIALFIFGLPYALVIGLAMALLGVIPFIGNILCLVPSCIIAYIHFNVAENRDGLEWMLGSSPWAYVVAVVAIFLIVQQINSLVTAPKIVGDSVGLHPMTVIFSMLFWSLLLGGFLGALIAVPMTAAVKVLFRRYIWEARINNDAENETEVAQT